MFELDTPVTIARFCRTSTNLAAVEFIRQYPPSSVYNGTFRVKGYRCYWAGVRKNGVTWDFDTLVVVDYTDDTRTVPEIIAESSVHRDVFFSLENKK